MAYQALYRQWRPADFSSMVGQEAVITTLRNQVATDRIAHAYLFCGSRGTGKTSAAKIMARAVNCLSSDNGNPCGTCESCQRLLREESLDVMEIDAASNNGVDEIRDLRETVKYPPQYGRFKVYIIDEVHMLSASAFNALLKTLEEPPAHVVFILATTEPQKLPATILSRCQRFDFGRIPAHQIVERLETVVSGAGATAEPQALHMIARAAEGGMRDALSILDMCLGYANEVTEALVRTVLGTSDRAFLFRFTEALEREDAASVMHLIDELMRGGREPMVFCKDLSQHLRALLVAKCCPEDMANLLDLTNEAAAEYQGQAETLTASRLMSMMELFMGAETDLRSASSPRLALENAALRACLRTGEADTFALTQRIEELEAALADMEKKLASGAFQVAATPKPAVATPTTEAAAENAPAAGSKAPVKVDSAVWTEAMNRFKKNDSGTYSILSMGQMVSCQDNHFRWVPRKEDETLFVGMLNQEKKRSAIAAALTEIAGVPCTFEALASVKAKPVMDSTNADFVAQMRQVFGAENVTVQEK